MSRFFFHRADGTFDPDNEGTELSDLADARVEAVRFAAESMRDKPNLVKDGHIFRVEVSDEAGMLLSTVVVMQLDAPGSRGVISPKLEGK